MRIGIITQPLGHNYGGILQNYALQEVLRDMGHQPITLRAQKSPGWFRWMLSVCKSILLRRKIRETPRATKKRGAGMRSFVSRYIKTSKKHRKYRGSYIDKYKLNAIIVGSDQVWRPRYNDSIEDMFLRFAARKGIKRIAYAASFGTNEWEFTQGQTAVCRELIKHFDAVSVREDSGITLCEKYLGYEDAEWVLDPTLLLSADRYEQLCITIPRRKPFLLAYILDMTQEKREFVERMAGAKHLEAHIVEPDNGITSEDSPARWLAMFRDAAFVVTDSFHGTVFSIIFKRDFLTLRNKERGNARFDSLISDFGIAPYVLSSIPSDPEEFPPHVDWEPIASRVQARQQTSISFLKRALQ